MYKQMPQIMKSNPDQEIDIKEEGEWLIMKVLNKSSRDVDVHAVHENFMVHYRLNKPEMAPAEKYLKATDLAGLATKVK